MRGFQLGETVGKVLQQERIDAALAAGRRRVGRLLDQQAEIGQVALGGLDARGNGFQCGGDGSGGVTVWHRAFECRQPRFDCGQLRAGPGGGRFDRVEPGIDRRHRLRQCCLGRQRRALGLYRGEPVFKRGHGLGQGRALAGCACIAGAGGGPIACAGKTEAAAQCGDQEEDGDGGAAHAPASGAFAVRVGKVTGGFELGIDRFGIGSLLGIGHLNTRFS